MIGLIRIGNHQYATTTRFSLQHEIGYLMDNVEGCIDKSIPLEYGLEEIRREVLLLKHMVDRCYCVEPENWEEDLLTDCFESPGRHDGSARCYLTFGEIMRAIERAEGKKGLNRYNLLVALRKFEFKEKPRRRPERGNIPYRLYEVDIRPEGPCEQRLKELLESFIIKKEGCRAARKLWRRSKRRHEL